MSNYEGGFIGPGEEIFHRVMVARENGTISVKLGPGMNLFSLEAWRNSIENIPDDVFINNPERRKNALRKKFEAVFEQISKAKEESKDNDNDEVEGRDEKEEDEYGGSKSKGGEKKGEEMQDRGKEGEKHYLSAIEKLEHDILEKLDSDGKADWTTEPVLVKETKGFIGRLRYEAKTEIKPGEGPSNGNKREWGAQIKENRMALISAILIAGVIVVGIYWFLLEPFFYGVKFPEGTELWLEIRRENGNSKLLLNNWGNSVKDSTLILMHENKQQKVGVNLKKRASRELDLQFELEEDERVNYIFHAGLTGKQGGELIVDGGPGLVGRIPKGKFALYWEQLIRKDNKTFYQYGSLPQQRRVFGWALSPGGEFKHENLREVIKFVEERDNRILVRHILYRNDNVIDNIEDLYLREELFLPRERRGPIFKLKLSTNFKPGEVVTVVKGPSSVNLKVDGRTRRHAVIPPLV